MTGRVATARSRSIYEWANPLAFQRIADPLLPWLWALGTAAILVAAYGALFVKPADYQQGESVRIMSVHVPAAWMAMFCYTSMAVASLIGFVFRHPLADIAAKSTAPVGAAFTFLCLVTGALWGKPTWGTYWVWDARLTSVLILFFLYLGYMAVWRAMDDQTRAARIAGVVCMVGFVNVPIIKFSVDWWNSLHQPASITRFDGAVTIPMSMLWPVLLMAVGYTLFATALIVLRMKTEIFERRLKRLSEAAKPAARVSIEAPGANEPEGVPS